MRQALHDHARDSFALYCQPCSKSIRMKKLLMKEHEEPSLILFLYNKYQFWDQIF